MSALKSKLDFLTSWVSLAAALVALATSVYTLKENQTQQTELDQLTSQTKLATHFDAIGSDIRKYVAEPSNSVNCYDEWEDGVYRVRLSATRAFYPKGEYRASSNPKSKRLSALVAGVTTESQKLEIDGVDLKVSGNVIGYADAQPIRTGINYVGAEAICKLDKSEDPIRILDSDIIQDNDVLGCARAVSFAESAGVIDQLGIRGITAATFDEEGQERKIEINLLIEGASTLSVKERYCSKI